MAFDGITNNALVNELWKKLGNGRIDKVYQPENDEIYISIRNNHNNYTLLLSANANNPRAYLTSHSKKNPLSPPTFCMLLRKNISRGRILSINQPSLERIIQIDIQCFNELGDTVVRTLIIEIMGRHSNIILIDKSTNTIIDSIKRVGSNISRYRQVLPGKEYIYPPDQNKINPLDVSGEKVILSLEQFPKGKKIEKFFINTFTGISPLISREICFISGVHSDKHIELLTQKEKKYLVESFLELMSKVKAKDFSPVIVYNQSKTQLIDFSVLPLKQFIPLPMESFDSTSSLLEHFYFEKDKLERIKQRTSNLLHLLQNKLERNYKKLGIQQDEYVKSQKAEIYKLYGELLTANIYSLQKGMEQVTLPNFYSANNEKIDIPLNPNLSPSQNAQKYFKKYNKSKNAILQLQKQIQGTKEDIYYLEGQINNIQNCSEQLEIEEIKEELRKEGFLSTVNKKATPKHKAVSSPLHFISSEGFHIYVGKNNRQNDVLTLKHASKEDLWLHVKDIPGSHVIIKSMSLNNISQQTLVEAASLAAYYSKGKHSSNVPVDYTAVKYVKKPRGAKPGMVIYDHNQTIFVTPKEEEIFSMKRAK